MGEYTFKIPGDTSPTLQYHGVGKYDSSSLTFSGELICVEQDLMTCGDGDYASRGSSASCAYTHAGFSHGGSPGYYDGGVVEVSALPVYNVTPS